MKKNVVGGSLFLFLFFVIVQISAAAVIPHAGWTLKYVDSQETVRENGAAINAFDGTPNTYWVTQWYGAAPGHPHEIQIDLGQLYSVSGFRYLPIQNQLDGRFGQYEFYVSEDGINWGTAVVSGTFNFDAAEKESLFAPKTGRYVRLRVLTEIHNNPYTSAAEINVLGSPYLGNFAPDGLINSPTGNATIAIGDVVSFIGTGSDPDSNFPLSYLWQFGSGSGIPNSTQQSPGSVKFNQAGTFPVTFTVTDALGLSDATPATRMVNVMNAIASVPDWRQVATAPFNLISPAGITNPILTKNDVTDAVAEFVADPFLFYESGTWYMFFEVMAGHGQIGLATSSDGLHWNYEQIVLDEDPCHHSYPMVFKFNGKYYMVPESYQRNAVIVYEATEFPYTWHEASTIVSGREFADASIFRYNNTWWMFVSDVNNYVFSKCYLYYSDDLLSGWVEHPMSPIVIGDAGLARPGGRSFVFDGGRIIRIAQKDDLYYGEQVRAFEVDLLTRTEYAEHEVAESPILNKSGTGWNAIGMHQFDPWWTGDRWLCAVDGHSANNDYSIGIYVSTQGTSHTITATAGHNGGISPSGSASVIPGGSQTFTIAASSGYSISDVKVDGSSVGAVSTYTFSNVTANHTIAATFAPVPVSVASVSSGKIDSGTSLTISHATSGSDRLMLVGVSLIPEGKDNSVSSITYNDIALTKVGSIVKGDKAKVEIWRLIAPAVGTSNVVITLNRKIDKGAVAGVMTFTGVNQTAPLGTFVSANGRSSDASVNVSSAVGEMIFGVVDAKTTSSLTQGAAQTERWDLIAGGDKSHGAGSTQSGTTTVTTSWKLASSSEWAIGAVSVKPAAP